MIIEWILLMLTFLIGYCLGLRSSFDKESFERPIKKAKEEIWHITHPKPKPGFVERPSQRDIYLKENPEIAEQEEEMKTAFDGLGVKNGG